MSISSIFILNFVCVLFVFRGHWSCPGGQFIFSNMVMWHIKSKWDAGPRSAVCNMSGYRCLSDCRSRGREFDPGPNVKVEFKQNF